MLHRIIIPAFIMAATAFACRDLMSQAPERGFTGATFEEVLAMLSLLARWVDESETHYA